MVKRHENQKDKASKKGREGKGMNKKRCKDKKRQEQNPDCWKEMKSDRAVKRKGRGNNGR